MANRTRNSSKAAQEAEDDSFVEKLWEKLEAKLNTWISSTLTEMVKTIVHDTISQTLNQLEKSQNFLSEKYDAFMEAFQCRGAEISNLRDKVREQEELIKKLEKQQDQNNCDIDQMEQYSRRECLEITGVPRQTGESTNRITQEISSLMGLDLTENDISVSHRLPDTRKQHDRMIVKFTRRDTRDEIYRRRKALIGKTVKNLPSFANMSGNSKIHVNESLTPYRKGLFSRIYAFKKKHAYKFIWTTNGRIKLRKCEDSTQHEFVTHEEFEKFLQDQSLDE